MHMKEKKSRKIIHVIFVILLCCVFAYFLLGGIFLPSDKLGEAGSVKRYSGEWERVLPSLQISLPVLSYHL